MIQQSSARKLAINMMKAYTVLVRDLVANDKCSEDLKKADNSIENYRALYDGVMSVLCKMGYNDEEGIYSKETIDYVVSKYKKSIRKHKWYANIKKYPSVAYKSSMILFDLMVSKMKEDGVIK